MAVYHDVNNNEELDKNFVGIPKEPYGFSGKNGFGSPYFDRVKFQLDEADKNLIIEIR